METSRPRVITIKESTEKYDLKAYTVRQWVKSGMLPAIYAGRKIFISEQILINFLNGKLDTEN